MHHLFKQSLQYGIYLSTWPAPKHDEIELPKEDAIPTVKP